MHGGSTEETAGNMQARMQRRQKQSARGRCRVRLAGDAVYFGKLYKKEFIGDSPAADRTGRHQKNRAAYVRNSFFDADCVWSSKICSVDFDLKQTGEAG